MGVGEVTNGLSRIPARIFDLTLTSLRQANASLSGFSRHNPGGPILGVLQAAHAGELLIKALIAKEHPLLIFKNLHEISEGGIDEFDVETLLTKGKTHDFSRLPNVYFAVRGVKIPDSKSFQEIGKIRNQIQHFVEPENLDFQEIALNFIFKNIDPLLFENYALCAIDFIDDETYDYLVKILIESETKFHIPKDFETTEIDLDLELQGASKDYIDWFYAYLKSNKIK